MLKNEIHHAAKILRQGGVVAYPTEAVFGLGADPTNFTAIEKLIHLKGRPPTHGFILLAATMEMLNDWVDFEKIPAARLDCLKQSWPGPITWVCPAQAHVSGVLTGHRANIAVRVSAHPLASALSRAFGGPIISTSANQHGQAPCRQAIDVSRIFDNAIDYLLSGNVGKQTNPTEIRDVLTNAVIRQS